jgi:hypothetical protein
MARPKGSPNVKVTTPAEPSRCHACGSTKRRKLGNRMLQEYGGLTEDGEPFTHIVRQRVQCEHCEQVRIERTLENYPDGVEPEE